MTLLRLILPEWASHQLPDRQFVKEGLFSAKQIAKHNAEGYNIFYFPNSPRTYDPGATVHGSHIDQFNWVFVDCDLKDGIYASKETFIRAIGDSGIAPTKIVDSGNGVHIYWRISNLDAMSYLRFQRRLMRLFKTDEAVGQLLQLMRYPGTLNTKNQNDKKECILLYENDIAYTAEEFDKLLPTIAREDEVYCQTHYDRTHGLNQDAPASDVMPPKFGKLLRDNAEVKRLWAEDTDDRSRNDYRLGHLMFANGFTKEEATSVLVNSAKALQRAPIHRQSYAANIISKIFTFEGASNSTESVSALSQSVKDILSKSKGVIKGTPFRCHPCIDNTEHGFRLGQVLGLVAGSGVGKTAFALNMFRWFTQNNPDYIHMFIPLEQPANEIADRWSTMCGDDTSLHDKVHIMSNYDDEGNFRHLSFDEIREYIKHFQTETGKKVGCVVIDHIGALKKKGKDGENQDIMDICHAMKAFSVQTNTFLIMQSQSSREKAGIGDLELNKDAAYGTVYFESYCDYLITLWQPLKRCHSERTCPTITAFKYCKIRHKKARRDAISEDVCYWLYFDSETELIRELTQDEITAFKFYLPKATSKRKADRKTELVSYQSVPKEGSVADVQAPLPSSNRLSTRH